MTTKNEPVRTMASRYLKLSQNAIEGTRSLVTRKSMQRGLRPQPKGTRAS